jgi:hypothetical protein
MWFKQKAARNKQSTHVDNCQSQLASIHSNGVELALPELLLYQNKTA